MLIKSTHFIDRDLSEEWLLGSHTDSLVVIVSPADSKPNPVPVLDEGGKVEGDAHDGASRQVSSSAEPVMDASEVKITSTECPVEEPSQPDNINPALETQEEPVVAPASEHRAIRQRGTNYASKEGSPEFELLENAKAKLRVREEQLTIAEKSLNADRIAFQQKHDRFTRYISEKEKDLEDLKKEIAEKAQVGEWLNELVKKAEAIFPRPTLKAEPSVSQLGYCWDSLLKVKSCQGVERSNLESMKAELQLEINAFKKMKEKDPLMEAYLGSRSAPELSYSGMEALLSDVDTGPLLTNMPADAQSAVFWKKHYQLNQFLKMMLMDVETSSGPAICYRMVGVHQGIEKDLPLPRVEVFGFGKDDLQAHMNAFEQIYVSFLGENGEKASRSGGSTTSSVVNGSTN